MRTTQKVKSVLMSNLEHIIYGGEDIVADFQIRISVPLKLHFLNGLRVSFKFTKPISKRFLWFLFIV